MLKIILHLVLFCFEGFNLCLLFRDDVLLLLGRADIQHGDGFVIDGVEVIDLAAIDEERRDRCAAGGGKREKKISDLKAVILYLTYLIHLSPFLRDELHALADL